MSEERWTREDGEAWFEGGCKERDAYRIGAEHEKFPFDEETHKPVGYDRIESLLKRLCVWGWEEKYEGENVVGLSHKGGGAITLEPAGQLELSGALQEDLHGVCRETRDHLKDVVREGKALGMGFLGLGIAPEWKHEEMPLMPKKRYDIMRGYMPKVGSRGLIMMHRSCTVQVNLDYGSEEDMRKKMRVGMALQGMVGALFASSPFFEGEDTGMQSYRLHVWRDVDKARSGLVKGVFDDNFGFRHWVDYLVDEVPMYFLKRGDELHDVSGGSFRLLMEGRLPGFEGEYAVREDWEEHVSVAFPDVRLKRYIEMRGADAGMVLGLCGLPAVWVGLLYDEGVLEGVYDMVKGWGYEELDELSERVPREGMRAEFRGRDVRTWLKEVMGYASEGLKRRGCVDGKGRDERDHLEGVCETLESGKSPSDVLLDKYRGDLSYVYDEWRYGG